MILVGVRRSRTSKEATEPPSSSSYFVVNPSSLPEEDAVCDKIGLPLNKVGYHPLHDDYLPDLLSFYFCDVLDETILGAPLPYPQGLSKGSDVPPNPPLGLGGAAVGVWLVEADVQPP